jgi:HSP20 family protein
MPGELFERYLRANRRPSRPSGRLWNPAADVYRTCDGWIVKVDLAGVRAADVEITIEGPLLRISGLRRDSVCGEGVSHYQLEITYSRFEKVVQFPCSIERETITRDYHDGLLIVQLRGDKKVAEETRGRTRAAGKS